MQIKHRLLTLYVLAVFSLASAQNNTSSPYTRYGLGMIENNTFGRGQAMGGTGIALRSNKTINPSNPASFSSIDTLSQIYEFGFFGKISNFKANAESQTNNDVNFSYLGMAFPISKNIGVALGVLPFSNVGYDYVLNESIDNIGEIRTINSGSGGITEAYVGISTKLFNSLALGVNLNYYFGANNHFRTLSFLENSDFSSFSSTERISVSAIKPVFGLQYILPMGDKRSFTLGATYEPKSSLNAKQDITTTKTRTGVTLLLSNLIDNPVNFELPEAYGFGVAYETKNKFVATAEFAQQNWSQSKYYNVTDTLNDKMRVGAGLEYIPNYISRNYLKRVEYRLGGYYSNSYLKGLGGDLYNIGMTFGLGLPLRYEKTRFNVSFEFGQMKSSNSSLLNETYGKVTINFSFNDYWFFRRKLE